MNVLIHIIGDPAALVPLRSVLTAAADHGLSFVTVGGPAAPWLAATLPRTVWQRSLALRYRSFAVLLFPLSILLAGGWLIRLGSTRPHAAVCLTWRDFLCLALPARVFKVRLCRLVVPGEEVARRTLAQRLAARFAAPGSILTLCSFTREWLIARDFEAPALSILLPAVAPADFRRQDTIFSQLADADRQSHQRKFWSIGTAVDLRGRQRMETLLAAAERTITVIPNLQLIILGDGPEKKTFAWLARQKGMDGFVWFVGEPAHRKQWLGNLDTFVVADEYLSLPTIALVLQAFDARVPVIGPRNIGLEDLVEDGTSGLLVHPSDPEDWARSLIRLRQDRALPVRLASAAAQSAAARFTVARAAETLSTTLLTRV